MLTKIDLCSMALLKLGEQPIQSLLDDTASAKLSRVLYDSVIDALIAVHPWRFATRQISLTRSTDGTFLIPSDVLRVLKADGHILGNKVISDADNTEILATVRVGPDMFPSYFVSLAATRLAMEFCVPLLGDQSVFRMLVALYESELQTAKFIDGTTTINDGISKFSLLDVRY